jgi:hypothetical protein
MCPDVDDLVITFIVGDDTHAVVIQHLFHLFVTLITKSSFSSGMITSSRLKDKTALEGH